MKLAMVLMLVALPVYCSAGSGCSYIEKAVSNARDSSITMDEYEAFFQEFIINDDIAQAIKEVKKCFLKQSEETLENLNVLMEAIYNSKWCAEF